MRTLSLWRCAPAGMLALAALLATCGCQWVDRTLDKTAIGGLLDDEKADDNEIKKAALKDSFPAATQSMPR